MSVQMKIPKQFWTQNPLKEMSAAQISYFSMTIFSVEELNEKISEIVSPRISADRRAAIEAELQEIEAMNNGESIVKFMRHEYDIANRNALCKKALEMQDDVIPLMLHRFRTSVQTVFIETAAMVFAHCDARYIVELREIYPAIRDPYARSIASLSLAVQKDEEAIPLLMQEYERLHREYPEESYDQGPLLALYRLCGKI
ncbi:MAG: hypothetical protein K2O45_12970 [Oscillospiraceae bacterium]|nr:hypothetical protein [Oscillospiraceae bacterium]